MSKQTTTQINKRYYSKLITDFMAQKNKDLNSILKYFGNFSEFAHDKKIVFNTLDDVLYFIEESNISSSTVCRILHKRGLTVWWTAGLLQYL